MLIIKAREVADNIFEVFGMTQLRIKPSVPRFAGKRSNNNATKLACCKLHLTFCIKRPMTRTLISFGLITIVKGKQNCVWLNYRYCRSTNVHKQ